MVRIESKNENLYAYLSGEIDHASSQSMREEIDFEVEKYHPQKLYLDFKGVTFMDSSGIGLVMGRYKQMEPIGGEVHVVNTSSHIKKVMSLSGLDRLVTLE